MKLVSVSEMKTIETEADEIGISFEKMMNNAGTELARIVTQISYKHQETNEILGLIGSGNNSGDTLIALTKLAEAGWSARAYLVKRKNDELAKAFESAGGEIIFADKDKNAKQLKTFSNSADVILDGLLGTGCKLPLKEEFSSVLSALQIALSARAWSPLIVAVDCPSGVECDSGACADETLFADVTVCMAAVKEGLLKFPAFERVGEIQIADIGLTDKVKSWKKIKHFAVDEEMIKSILPKRANDSHKGSFGRALIAAGSFNYTGAPLLAGKAAYRVGAGLVTLAVPATLHTALAGQLPEATWILLPHDMGAISANAVDVILKNIESKTAFLFGPGLGMEDKTKEFVENLLQGKQTIKGGAQIGFVRKEEEKKDEKNNTLPPLVIDADGLNLLAKISDWHSLLPADTILTPHVGEMAVLTGLSKDEIQSDRVNIALRFAKTWNCVVVLKGAFTVVANPVGDAAVVPVATSALAHAGMGDVLAGMIVGFRAQGVGAYHSALAGAWIHAQAGLFAAEEIGNPASVLASDVLDAISDALSDLK